MDELEEMTDTELDLAPERTPEFEFATTPGEAETEALHAAIAASGEAQRATLARLRQAFLESDPALDPALLSGDTLEELEASYAAAKTMLANIRDSLRREQAAAIPAGASGRTSPRHLTAIEKIRAGLA